MKMIPEILFIITPMLIFLFIPVALLEVGFDNYWQTQLNEDFPNHADEMNRLLNFSEYKIFKDSYAHVEYKLLKDLKALKKRFHVKDDEVLTHLKILSLDNIDTLQMLLEFSDIIRLQIPDWVINKYEEKQAYEEFKTNLLKKLKE